MTIRRSTLARLGFVLVLICIVGMMSLLALITGCGGGVSYSGAGADAVPLKPNMTEAITRVSARGDEWLVGVDSIKAADRAPPPGVNFATVKCPGDVVFYNTTFDKSAEFFEALLVHEAWEIQHGCKDYDEASGVLVECYREGRPHAECKEKVEREFY